MRGPFHRAFSSFSTALRGRQGTPIDLALNQPTKPHRGVAPRTGRFLCEQSVALPVHLRLQLLVGDPHHGTEPRQNAWIDETLEPNEVALSEDILLRCPLGVPAMFGTAHGQPYHGSYSGYARRRGSSRERRTDFRVGERRWNVTASEDARGGRPGEGRREPPVLPLVMDAQEFGLSPEKLLPFLEREMRLLGDGRGRTNPDVPGRAGYRDPPIGTVFGKRLAARIGSLLSRPWCTFANSFLWTSGRGARQGAHLDRPVLDVTMSIPLSLDGADRWPLWVEQPGGSRFEWAGALGTILILDGRHRMHGRDAFEGRRSVVLLLHWTAPAVLWPGFLDQDARSRLTAAAGKIERGAPARRRGGRSRRADAALRFWR